MRKAWVITPNYNSRRYIKACVLSVTDQLKHYPNLRHIIVDDLSTDGTWERLGQDDIRGEHQIIVQNERHLASALGSFLYGLDIAADEGIDDEDVVFWVDGDDWITMPDTIKTFMKAYDRNGSVEMAYSRHTAWHGNETVTDGYSKEPPKDRTMWRYDWVRYSHLRSFKYSMIYEVSPYYLCDEDGNPWKFAGDSALFLPMLEVAKRVKYIDKPLYAYNMERADSEAKKDETTQTISSVTIRSMVPNLNNRKEVHPSDVFTPVRRFKVDHGRACNLSCQFCYYLHQKPWRNKTDEEVFRIIDAGAARGNRSCDISGGEPTISASLPKWIAYASSKKVYPGIITHGQDLVDKLPTLWNAGLQDILFSVHGLREYHNAVTGTCHREGWHRLFGAMDKCSSEGFKFRTNTVLTENFEELPELAKELSRVSPYISNFINFNPYNEWNEEEKPFQAKVSDIAPYLKGAIDILADNGTMVNVRYFPFCVLKGYEKHIVNMYQVMFDPYEWDYGVMPKTVEAYKQHGVVLAERTCAFTKKCESCSIAGSVCCGVNKVYLKTFGDGELEPYGGQKIDGEFYFRRNAEPGQLYTFIGHNYPWSARRYQRIKEAQGNGGGESSVSLHRDSASVPHDKHEVYAESC